MALRVKNWTFSWAQYMRGCGLKIVQLVCLRIVRITRKSKIFINELSFPLFSWTSKWEDLSKSQRKATLTERHFRRDKWKVFAKALSNVPWQFHTHSSDTFSPTRAGRPCAMTISNASDFLGLHCRTATGKAMTVGAGQWYFSKELGGSAGVKFPWTRFAVGCQMNPGAHGGEAK